MHNVLRPHNLGDFRTSNGEHIWVKRENPVAEARAAQESPRPSSAPNVDELSQLIRPRDIQSGYRLWIHSLHVNSANKGVSFKPVRPQHITASAAQCTLERSRFDKQLSGKQNLAAANRLNTTCQILLSRVHRGTHHISWFSK